MADANRRHFHHCILSFITTGFRLSKWHWISTWNNFHNEYRCRSYEDLSSREIKKEFEDVVLPKIFSYELTYEQKNKIASLKTYQVCGPKLEATAEGFNVVRFDRELEQGLQAQIIEDIDFTTNSRDENHLATLVLNSKDFDVTKFNADGNMPVRKCISLLLQDEKERLQESLLSWQEIKYRFKKKQSVCVSEEIIKESKFMEKLQQGSSRHMQKKMASCLAHQMELRYAGSAAVHRRVQVRSSLFFSRTTQTGFSSSSVRKSRRPPSRMIQSS